MKELVTKRKKYLIILQMGICPPKVITRLNSDDDILLIMQESLTAANITRVMIDSDYASDKVLVIGNNLGILMEINTRTWCCVGVLLNENERITFVENGFSFHDWQEVLDIISNKKVKQMMSKDASVWDIILALQDLA